MRWSFRDAPSWAQTRNPCQRLEGADATSRLWIPGSRRRGAPRNDGDVISGRLNDAPLVRARADVCNRLFRRRARPAGMADKTDPDPGRLRAGRQHRCDGADHRAGAFRAARPARHHREPPRCGRQHRRRSRSQGRSGRHHPHAIDELDLRHQSEPLQKPALRRPGRFRADRADRLHPEPAGRQSIRSGQQRH